MGLCLWILSQKMNMSNCFKAFAVDPLRPTPPSDDHAVDLEAAAQPAGRDDVDPEAPAQPARGDVVEKPQDGVDKDYDYFLLGVGLCSCTITCSSPLTTPYRPPLPLTSNFTWLFFFLRQRIHPFQLCRDSPSAPKSWLILHGHSLFYGHYHSISFLPQMY
uniref:Uncharacterized protein n=1 Tax=Fagus sylvatica TaxID=28930 RepID=A0A2N9IDX4_FAGSY